MSGVYFGDKILEMCEPERIQSQAGNKMNLIVPLLSRRRVRGHFLGVCYR